MSLFIAEEGIEIGIFDMMRTEENFFSINFMEEFKEEPVCY